MKVGEGDKENKPAVEQEDEAVQRGRAAIEADKKVNSSETTPDTKEGDRKDAENWRNEG